MGRGEEGRKQQAKEEEGEEGDEYLLPKVELRLLLPPVFKSRRRRRSSVSIPLIALLLPLFQPSSSVPPLGTAACFCPGLPSPYTLSHLRKKKPGGEGNTKLRKGREGGRVIEAGKVWFFCLTLSLFLPRTVFGPVNTMSLGKKDTDAETGLPPFFANSL